MLYLLRFAETGREAQARRRKTSRDIVAVLGAEIDDLRVLSTDTGRILVHTARDALPTPKTVHGLSSFSPCRHCRLDELEASIVELCRHAVRDASSFCVRIKRVGTHAFTSAEMAASLGACIRQQFPAIAVDLDRPDVVIGVEIRQVDCYVFDRVIPGADRRPNAARDSIGNTTPAGPVRFLVDQMLGPLAGWLRLLGFDSAYLHDVPDCHLVRRARAEGRVILTRDRQLSETPAVTAYYVYSTSLPRQLIEVAELLDLRYDPERMFTRCSLCNRPVEPVEKASIATRVPRVAYQQYDEFTFCRTCDKLYWKGGQYRRILRQLRHLVAPTDDSARTVRRPPQ